MKKGARRLQDDYDFPSNILIKLLFDSCFKTIVIL